MTLETGNYIADITVDGGDVVQYPENDISVAELDNHIRQFKQMTYNSFPNVSSRVTASAADLDAVRGVAQNIAIALHGSTSGVMTTAARTGSPATDYAVTTGEAIASLHVGFRITFLTPDDGVNCDDAPTCTLDAVAAKTITKHDGTAISAGDIVADQLLELVYNGSAFRVISAL